MRVVIMDGAGWHTMNVRMTSPISSLDQAPSLFSRTQSH